MHHLKAFGDKLTNAAKDLQKDFSSATKETKLNGRQYVIGGKTVAEERKLSEGGFAFVYIVRDVYSNQEYALKKMLCQVRANSNSIRFLTPFTGQGTI